MTGKFLLKSIKNDKIFKTSFYYDLDMLTKHNHIYFTLDNGMILIYNDVRRFGFFKIFEKKELYQISFLNKLGLEPFSKFLEVLNKPYLEQKNIINYQMPLFSNQKYQTFCGT